MELECSVQKYAWGKLGHSSAVARLMKGCSSQEVKEASPYAELWMGTHPNGPSIVKELHQPLQDYIKKNPSVLGEKTRQAFGDQLPFLFKVLSVGQALSIQAHPDKQRAEILHKTQPDLYKDPNHKPEMAIALTPFTALCGFRPAAEIRKFTESIQELREAMGEENVKLLDDSSESSKPEALKKAFACLMSQPKGKVEAFTQGVMKRVDDPNFVAGLDLGEQGTLLVDTLKRISKDFPGDIGLLGVFLFNLIVLQPGEAIFLGPNDPHAYLSGDCIECMACSDNVVRAGLTPKYIDVETLVDMLIYEFSSAEEKKFVGTPSDLGSYLKAVYYDPPVDDFSVARYEVTVPPGEVASVTIPAVDSASVILVIDSVNMSLSLDTDENLELRAGKVFFLPAGKKFVLDTAGGSALLFRAYIKL